MNHMCKLIVGDTSHDGHGLTYTGIIKSNRTYLEIMEAYKGGTKIVGFDLSKTVAWNPDDDYLPLDNATSLQHHGIDLSFIEDFEEIDDIFLLQEEYIELYLKICHLADREFRYEIVNLNSIDIGGYGLFGGD